MQPDIALIEHHIQAIGDKVNPVRTAMKHKDPVPSMIATLHMCDGSFEECNRLRSYGPMDLIEHISAHEELHLEALQREIIQSGHAIREQFKKSSLLDHNELMITLHFYKTSARDYCISLEFDAYNLYPGKGEHLRRVMPGLEALFHTLSMAPPHALKGKMSGYYVEGSKGVTAPSREALAFKCSVASELRKIMSIKTLSGDHPDHSIIRRELAALPQTFGKTNAA